MKIEHLAIWTQNLEKSKDFFTTYFKMKSGEKYTNTIKQFQSYFLSFGDASATRIELMQRPDIVENKNIRGNIYGYAHIAISVGDKDEVNRITEQLRTDGYKVVGEPRTTGDGYYESVIEDAEGNWIEITE